MRRLAALALAAGTLLLGECSCAQAAPVVVPEPAALLREDRRVGELLVGGARSGFYDRDLSDPVPLLLEKLERARPDPLKRAKEELGLLGERAFPLLENAFHSYYTDMMRSPFLENTVDALAFSTTDDAHELLLEALQHPQESVRSKALDGLGRQARPADFDILTSRLGIETRELRRQSVAALFRADAARAEALFLDYLVSGEQRELWITAVPRLAQTHSVETARRCAELFPTLEPLLGVHLAAAAAQLGEGAALDFLRGELRSEDLQRRMAAVNAIQRAGRVGELRHSLLEDPSAELRAICAAALAAQELDDERRTWLRSALNDGSPVVQAEALKGLCAHGDPEGLARALVQLDGEPGEMQPALQALRAPLRTQAGLARTVYERLLQRHALEEHRPVQQRTATFKAMGQVPLREAAEFLHRIGVEAGAEKIESLRAHDWLMIQAANTASAGRGYLAERLLEERDPLLRLDLVDAVGSARDELARATLGAVAEDPANAPLERLFAASAWIKVGPSWEVAPRLKRVAYSMQGQAEAEARAALQCLLWMWY
ncbi:MAG: hypothetical protein EXS08_05455 [Planctomycetes bacterium]|nr:hypothetical protein [Planctomycetota bacterium]